MFIAHEQWTRIVSEPEDLPVRGGILRVAFVYFPGYWMSEATS